MNNDFQEFLKEINLNFFQYNSSDEGISFLIDVWAKPGSKVEKYFISESGELVIFLKERPVDGAANKSLLKILSKIFGTPISFIELNSGGRSKFKRFSVTLPFTERKRMPYYLEKIKKLK